MGASVSVVEVFCTRLCLLDSRSWALMLESARHSRCPFGFLKPSPFLFSCHDDCDSPSPSDVVHSIHGDRDDPYQRPAYDRHLNHHHRPYHVPILHGDACL